MKRREEDEGRREGVDEEREEGRRRSGRGREEGRRGGGSPVLRYPSV